MLEKRGDAKRIATLAYASDNPFMYKYFIFSAIKIRTPMKHFHCFCNSYLFKELFMFHIPYITAR